MAVLPIFMFDAELRLQERFEEVKNAFLAHPQVLSATVCWPDPTWEPKRVLVQKAGGTRMDLEMELITADHDFLETFGMELVSGRNFMPEVANELKVPIILNETAVRQLGWQNAIGKPFSPYPNMQGQVIGVVKDFHTLAFHEKIQPLMLLPGGHMMIALRMAPENRSGTVAFLKQTWEELSSNPFQIRFVEDILDNRYEAEALLSTACTVFSAFSVFVGILGLVGLTSYNVEQRIKEVAIRKAFGAGMGDILTLLSNECLQSVLLASVIGWVCAYYFMDQWLQGFAYRIDLGLAVFPLCGLVILSIALLAVGTLVLRATMRNPVEFLRNE